MLVPLPTFDNPAVNLFVETENVCALEPIGATGTRISLAQGASELTAGPYVNVLGTPAAIAAALGGFVGFGVVLGVASFNGATGAFVGGFGILAGAAGVRNGAGDYTITPTAAFPAGAIPFAVLQSGVAGSVSVDGPPGATQNVLSFDAAGAPGDQSFVLVALGPPV